MRDQRIVKLRREAMKEGAVTYFTGLPCRFGHVAKRYTQSGKCTECNRVAYKRYPPSIERLQKMEKCSKAWKALHREHIRVLSQIRLAKMRAAFHALKQLGINI